MLAEFRPEFSFKASAVPRDLATVTESEVDRCLMWDMRLGLEAEPAHAEHACLVVPPGHAIVDTGCASTLVGSESEKRWREELSRQTGGHLRPERGPSDVKFEGISGEAKATCQVKYPVKLGGREGFIKASVIPGKAPFLLSIQALRQMRAKLDCENHTLDIPGIGRISLDINSVGHYMLPLFGFEDTTVKPSPPPGLAHGMTASAEDKPEDEEFLEEVSRRDRVNPQQPSSHPPVPPEFFQWKPRISELSKRTDKPAKSTLLRLAKDTKGPWVQLPQELATVHLILGRHGFISPDMPWQIRAAQIGYRSKVVRRPPPEHMSEACVLVFALGDRCFKVLQDWTACSDCTGKRLETEASDARLFLFVFATRPTDRLPACHVSVAQEQECLGTSECAGQALMVRHRIDSCDSAAPTPPLLQSTDLSNPEFLSCDEGPQHDQLRVPVCDHRELASSRVRPCGFSSRGGVRQRPGSDLALRFVQAQVQDMPGTDGKTGALDGSGHLHSPARLRLHHGSRADGLQHNDLACHRRSHPHGRRRDCPAKVFGDIPFDIRKVTLQKHLLHPKALPPTLSTPGSSTSSSMAKAAATRPRIVATVTTDQIQAAQMSMPTEAQSMAPHTAPPSSTAYMPRPVPQPAAATTTPDLGTIMQAVKKMINEEYGATPVVVANDITMEKPLIEQAQELEGQAAELLARAAGSVDRRHLRPPLRLRHPRRFPRPGWQLHFVQKAQQDTIPILPTPGSRSCCVSCYMYFRSSDASPAFCA